MTNSTTSKNQVQDRFTNATQDIAARSSDRNTEPNETSSGKREEITGGNLSDREYNYWLEQKLSQRSYIRGYKGF